MRTREERIQEGRALVKADTGTRRMLGELAVEEVGAESQGRAEDGTFETSILKAFADDIDADFHRLRDDYRVARAWAGAWRHAPVAWSVYRELVAQEDREAVLDSLIEQGRATCRGVREFLRERALTAASKEGSETSEKDDDVTDEDMGDLLDFAEEQRKWHERAREVVGIDPKRHVKSVLNYMSWTREYLGVITDCEVEVTRAHMDEIRRAKEDLDTEMKRLEDYVAKKEN